MILADEGAGPEKFSVKLLILFLIRNFIGLDNRSSIKQYILLSHLLVGKSWLVKHNIIMNYSICEVSEC